LTTEALKLDVHVQGDEFHEFKNFVVIIIVYFRLMLRNLNPRYLSSLPSNSQEMILLQIEDDKSTVFAPKLLKWDEISLPDKLEIPKSVPSAQIDRRDIDQIVEEPDGRVILQFRSRSIREDISIPEPLNYRRSFSKYSTKSGPINNSRRYTFRDPIIELIIDPPSPTDSGIKAGINVIINRDFQINLSHLKEDYYSLENSSKRLSFKRMERNFHEDLKKPWIADTNRLRVDIPFFIWLIVDVSSSSAQCTKTVPAPAPALAQTPAALAQVSAAVHDSAESDSSQFQLNPEASRGSLFSPLCNLHKFVTL